MAVAGGATARAPWGSGLGARGAITTRASCGVSTHARVVVGARPEGAMSFGAHGRGSGSGVVAAVGVQDRARDVGRGGARQESDRRGYFFGAAHALQGQ